MVFSYNHGSDFYRLKVFPSIKSRTRHKIKYLQPAGSEPHLYWTKQAEKILNDSYDPSPLWVCEGEKKALRLAQERLPSIGVGDVYCWKRKDRMGLISDFDEIPIKGREVYLVADSDFSTNDNVRLVYYRLSSELMARGAIVYLIVIP